MLSKQKKEQLTKYNRRLNLKLALIYFLLVLFFILVIVML